MVLNGDGTSFPPLAWVITRKVIACPDTASVSAHSGGFVQSIWHHFWHLAVLSVNLAAALATGRSACQFGNSSGENVTGIFL